MRPQPTGNDIGERALAGSIRANKAVDVASLDGEDDIAQHLWPLAVAKDDAPEFDDHLLVGCPRARIDGHLAGGDNTCWLFAKWNRLAADWPMRFAVSGRLWRLFRLLQCEPFCQTDYPFGKDGDGEDRQCSVQHLLQPRIDIDHRRKHRDEHSADDGADGGVDAADQNH